MKRAPLPIPLPPRASQGEEAEDFSDGGCIKKVRPNNAPTRSLLATDVSFP